MVLPLLTFLLYTLSNNKAGSCDLDVVLIGGVISGLGAAQELLYQGCRVGSTPSPNEIIGASWIHGIGPGNGDLER
jgi:hypothetical protein